MAAARPANHDFVTVHQVEDVEPVTGRLASLCIGRHDEPPHLEEDLGQRSQKLLMPAFAALRHSRMLDKVVAYRISAAISVQVAECVSGCAKWSST